MFANLLKRELAGICFGSKGIVIVQQSAGKMKNYLSLPYPAQGAEGAAVVSESIFEVFKNKEMEIVAFLQKAIRDSHIDATSVVVALPPKDLIIRFFEMPNIPKSEVLAGINFEMKKYVPFKIEELAYDFQYRVKQKTNIIEVILCGIKQDPLDKYINLFKQLNLSVVSFEPGLFSLFRLLVIRSKILSHQSCIVLEFDREDANILITEKGFPYFTRDIKLISPGAGVKSQDEFDAVLFRLINEVRVSLDYYRRQFMKKDVDELIIISDKSYGGWTDNFSKELGLKVNFIGFNDLLKIKEAPEEMLSDLCKGFGAALKTERPSLITLNLGKGKEKAERIALGALASEAGLETVLGFLRDAKSALVKGGAIGFVLLVMIYGIGFSKLLPLEKEVAAVSVKQVPLLPGVDVSSLEGVQASEGSFLRKQRDFREAVEDYSALYKKLALLPRLIPPGVWLSNFSYSRVPMTLHLSCSAYAADEKIRSEAINRFVENLKKEGEVTKDMPSVELTSYREMNNADLFYMQFDVECGKKSN